MAHGLRFTEKPNEFCMTVISWEVEGHEPVKITEVYHGFEELSSVGPFLHCDYRWELYSEWNKHELFVWTSKTRDGDKPADNYDTFSIYRSINNGQSWEKIFSSTPGGLLAKR